MAASPKVYFAHTSQSDVEQTDTSPHSRFEAYKDHTSIVDKRRDASTKMIDKLVQVYLNAPHDINALQQLHIDAARHLERLQRASPMRHALVSTQLNLIVAQAARIGRSDKNPVHAALEHLA